MANQHKIRVTTKHNDAIVMICESCKYTFFDNGTAEASFNRMSDAARRHRKKPVEVRVDPAKVSREKVGEITTTYMDETGAVVRGIITDATMLDAMWEPGHRGRPGYSDSMLS